MTVLLSCRQEPADNQATRFISSITAETDPDNALREKIRIDFKTRVPYYIEYWKASDESSLRKTRRYDCNSEQEVELLLLEPATQYHFCVHLEDQNQIVKSDIYSFTTKGLPGWISTYEREDFITEPIQKKGYIHIASKTAPGYLFLLNDKGTIVWYQSVGKGVNVSTFDPRFNTFQCILGNHPANQFAGSEILVIDLWGKIHLKKQHSELKNGFVHHDMRRLENGNLIVVNYVPKTFDLTKWGGTNTETVVGDGYTILDMTGKEVYAWDCFNEMNPQNDPDIMGTLGALGPVREDWLHANSIQTDNQGYVYMSFNWINQIWKIDGKTGKVVYRLGKDGNINLPAEALTQGVHSVSIAENGNILFLDNGQETAISRAVAVSVNESGREGNINLNISFPKEYSTKFQGSVYPLSDNFYLYGSSNKNAILFSDSSGEIYRKITTKHAFFRAEYIPEINY
ncbi:MAG: aryl-sulfate sulfotransferase [Bacteroidales bacterium]